MKYLFLVIISILAFEKTGAAQSLEDLKNIEKLQKQIEKMGELPAKSGVQPEPDTQYLEVFKDSLSTIPEIKQSALNADSIAFPTSQGIKRERKGPFDNLEIFGLKVFSDARIDTDPETYGPADKNYPLGPGDEIVISIWGEVKLRHVKKLNRQGQIYIEEVGLVNLMGMTIDQVQRKLISVMGQSYSSLLKDKAYLDVSLGKLRAIRIFVVGDVNNPGVFTIPALGSGFGLLFYAGGVTAKGSLRDIALVRNDKIIHHFDLYKFLINGQRFSNIRLHTNDVIVIPPVANRVYLAGAVQKPAAFELKENEGLVDLIQFCGGFRADAYLKTIQIERIVSHTKRELIDVDYTKLLEDKSNFNLEDGDRILVSSIDRDLKNYVTIAGPIYGPKRFEYYPGFTINELFSRVDSISGEAYLDRVQITRKLPDGKAQIFSINLDDFIYDTQQDFLLAPQDHIVIRSKTTLFPADSISISGAVNSPGKYLLKKNMTLKDLIFAADGYSKNALITEAEISRVDFNNTDPNRIATIIYIKLDSNYSQSVEFREDALFFLEPYDNVFIRWNSDWELQRNVSVNGEVRRPGMYTLKTKTTRITDIIQRAGGLKSTAYLEGAKLYRSADGVGQIGIDFKKIFTDPADEENIFLQNGDRITIPERLATVKVVGGVNFPSSVLFEKGEGLDYYISAAGGYTELADEDNATIRLANGRPVQRNHFLFWKYLSEDITAGTTIYVPVLSEKDKIDWSGAVRDAAAILASIATVILIYDRVSDK